MRGPSCSMSDMFRWEVVDRSVVLIGFTDIERDLVIDTLPGDCRSSSPSIDMEESKERFGLCHYQSWKSKNALLELRLSKFL